MKKKIMAGLLAFCMVVTMLPLTAFAAEVPTAVKEPDPITLEAKNLSEISGEATFNAQNGLNDAPAVTLAGQADVSWAIENESYNPDDENSGTEFLACSAKADLTKATGVTVTTQFQKEGTDAKVDAANVKSEGTWDVYATWTAGKVEVTSANPASTKKVTISASTDAVKVGSLTVKAEPTMPEKAFQVTLGMFTEVQDATAEYTGSSLAAKVSAPTYSKPETEGAPDSVTATVIFKQGSEVVEAPTKAGTYKIFVKVADFVATAPDGISYKGFETDTGKTLTITKKARTLSVTAPEAAELTVGAEGKSLSFTDNADDKKEGYKYTITNSNTKAAEVDPATGALTLKETGKVVLQITAPATDNYAASEMVQVTFTVKGQERTISVKDETVSLNMQDSVKTAQIEVLDENDKAYKGKVTYEIDKTAEGHVEGAVTVSESGLITAETAGKATIKVTAAADSTHEASDPVTVTVTVTDMNSVDITVPTTTIQGTATKTLDVAEQLAAKFQPANGSVTPIDVTKINLASSDEDVVTVSGRVLSFVAPGKATITASVVAKSDGTDDENYAAASATFEVQVSALEVEITSVTLTGADSLKYNGNDRKPTGFTVNYKEKATPETTGTLSTLDTDYTVSYSGDLKGPGKVTVTVTPAGKYTGKAFTVPAAGVEDADYSYEIGKATQAQNAEFETTVKPEGKTVTIDLSNVTDMPADGKVTAATMKTDNTSTVDGYTFSNNKTFTLNFKGSVDAPSSNKDIITVTVSTALYEEFKVDVTVNYTNLKLATIDKDSVTLQVAEKLTKEKGQCANLEGAELEAHKADDHKCYDKGYRLATIADSYKSAIVCIVSDGEITKPAAGLPTGVEVSDKLDDDALAALHITPKDNENYYKITMTADAVKASATVKFAAKAGATYAATDVYVTITVNEVALTKIPSESGDTSTEDPTPVDPTPAEEVDVTTDENGQITEEKEADTVLNVTNEEAGVTATVPAGVEGTVEATITKDEESGEITVDVKVNGEALDANVDTTVSVTDEQKEAGDKLVAYVVDENGNKTALPKSVLGEDGLKTQVPNGSKIVVEEAKNDLTDLDKTSEDAAKAITYVADRGIMKGKDNNSAAADELTSRYEVAVFLHRLEMENAVDSELNFEDVLDGQWYTNAAVWADSNKIITGRDGDFAGGEQVKRIEFILMLYRYAVKFAPQTLANSAESHEFNDIPEWGEETEKAVLWAVGNGITFGNGDGSFGSGDAATRWQIASFLERFLKKL